MKTFRYRIQRSGDNGTCEITSAELAAEIRREGRLGVVAVRDRKGMRPMRCLYGVLWDYRGPDNPCRIFSADSWDQMTTLGLRAVDNDAFVGTPEERCEYFAALLEAL